MAEEEYEIVADPVFVGLTRPPLLFGVSYTFELFNAMICMMGYIGTSQFKYMAAILPIHMVGYYLCSKEPLFIELFKVRAEKCSRCTNKMFHNANSYDPY